MNEVRSRVVIAVVGVLVAAGFAAAAWSLFSDFRRDHSTPQLLLGIGGCVIAGLTVLIPLASALIPETDRSERIRQNRKARVVQLTRSRSVVAPRDPTGKPLPTSRASIGR